MLSYWLLSVEYDEGTGALASFRALVDHAGAMVSAWASIGFFARSLARPAGLARPEKRGSVQGVARMGSVVATFAQEAVQLRASNIE